MLLFQAQQFYGVWITVQQQIHHFSKRIDGGVCSIIYILFKFCHAN